MPNQRMFRILLAVACFVFAGVKGWQILQGEYEWMDIFFLIAFLGFGIMYVVLLSKNKPQE
ncbi:hypothetical protein [Pontibacter ramchanderi]|uniref:Uncharacterized protein n=1 Tax=Pontibacter ramchanderi TaxID=1179743 RepID=A0A2N3UAD5_9BACT|nr:hypothetical protein [Pontibacter ramchanderi]PKV66305.1 hypothetical protein BD749_1430 [Pontibacter ramchanderi]